MLQCDNSRDCIRRKPVERGIWPQGPVRHTGWLTMQSSTPRFPSLAIFLIPRAFSRTGIWSCRPSRITALNKRRYFASPLASLYDRNVSITWSNCRVLNYAYSWDPWRRTRQCHKKKKRRYIASLCRPRHSAAIAGSCLASLRDDPRHHRQAQRGRIHRATLADDRLQRLAFRARPRRDCGNGCSAGLDAWAGGSDAAAERTRPRAGTHSLITAKRPVLAPRHLCDAKRATGAARAPCAARQWRAGVPER